MSKNRTHVGEDVYGKLPRKVSSELSTCLCIPTIASGSQATVDVILKSTEPGHQHIIICLFRNPLLAAIILIFPLRTLSL